MSKRLESWKGQWSDRSKACITKKQLAERISEQLWWHEEISREWLEKLFAEVKRTKYHLKFYDLLNYIKQAEKNWIETSDIEDKISQLRKECIERWLNICRLSLINPDMIQNKQSFKKLLGTLWDLLNEAEILDVDINYNKRYAALIKYIPFVISNNSSESELNNYIVHINRAKERWIDVDWCDKKLRCYKKI